MLQEVELLQNLRYGKFCERPPVPHVPEKTLYFEAGPVRFGVEYRHLNMEVLAGYYGAERASEIVAGGFGRPDVASESEDEGLSVHVFDTATGTEHLRFDDLDSNKHYHYLLADGHHSVVWYDDVANGEFLPWVLATLATRLREMLTLAGAERLVGSLDDIAIREALAQVRSAVRLAEASTLI